ncbi:MAG: hypothetical protein A2857_05835 [Candidatus Levybacteria bacterium RIFCSPHIGHO2_01_FULL_36_15]|nr:MAG: hypothetical protein A2857_05835 [Candidatus Levybacteria bacterium RIFCSPHIGHO2_01_FULL_36_15]OGH38415.1 MAG: hypothetical protein A2905_00635 [Candidatus Levybacteria bacterium RIFCSPLOWO2_01_FULL_36_10]
MNKISAKLNINTRDNKKIIIKLEVNGKEYKKYSINPSIKSEIVLSLIDQALKESRTSIENIDSISVEKGPGSFTGLKVGVAIANALSFALLQKLNNMKLGAVESPLY